MRVETISTPTTGRYLVSAPPDRARAPLLVGFHGYGENAGLLLEQVMQVPGAERWLLVSVQALHRFYNTKTGVVVASWMTREDREATIRDNVAYVRSVVAAVRDAHETEGRVVYLGFSQGASMAWRAAAHLGASGVVALGGDIPPDVAAGGELRLPPSLVGRGAGDTWYTAEKLAADLRVLEERGTPAESLVFDGGHEWTDAFRAVAGRFLEGLPQGP